MQPPTQPCLRQVRGRGNRRACFATAVGLSVLAGLTITVSSCGGASAGLAASQVSETSLIAELDALSRGAPPALREAMYGLLSDNLAKDAFSCLPSAQRVFSRPLLEAPERRIRGRMPHYGLYFGPMNYRVTSAGNPGQAVWVVRLNIAFVPSRTHGNMELPDCSLRAQLHGELRCEGIAFTEAPGLEACPDSGHFEAPASRHNLRVLLAHWSTQAESDYNRDAAYFGLPVRYDFNFFLADDSSMAARPIDLRLPLWLSCGRTPYFIAFRSGWSVPVVAHEVSHYLGLLDEYEAFSGVFSFYPKTPFEGSEQSRMGVSMKTHTRLWPLHHYLILRRYHCSPPKPHDTYGHVLTASVPIR
jgi:hypothetical protein